MNIDQISFHDSKILEVKENTENHILEFRLDFIDWDKEVTEKRTLKFSDVIYYCVDEIPYQGSPAIMEIINSGEVTETFSTGRNQLTTSKQKIEMKTTAGSRIIKFSACEFIN